MSRQGISSPTTGSPRLRLRSVPSDRVGSGRTTGPARAALDHVLELVGRRRLSTTELRVLLRLVDREAAVPELAEALGHRTGEIRHAGRRLAMRGLVRWHHVGWKDQTRLDITRPGLATVQAMLTAARQGQATGDRAPMNASGRPPTNSQEEESS